MKYIFFIVYFVTCANSQLFASEKFNSDDNNSLKQELEKKIVINRGNLSRQFNENKARKCFCHAGCSYGDGDSFHFDKTYDISCSLSLEDKKKKVAREMITHFLDEHGLDSISEINNAVEITCYNIN